MLHKAGGGGFVADTQQQSCVTRQGTADRAILPPAIVIVLTVFGYLRAWKHHCPHILHSEIQLTPHRLYMRVMHLRFE